MAYKYNLRIKSQKMKSIVKIGIISVCLMIRNSIWGNKICFFFYHICPKMANNMKHPPEVE